MKRLTFIMLALLFITATVHAKKYYVSAAGNDANNGTSFSTPWQTIAKVNSFTFAANDTILFRRGDTFYGCINVSRDSLDFSCYGTGDIPYISGFTAASSWTSLGGGIWEAGVANAKNNLTLVSMDGIPQEMGRYPNSDAANGGYLTYESASGSSSITDNQLTASPDWDGAEVCIRKNNWTLDRDIITSHSGTVINYRIGRGASPYTLDVYGGVAGFGYFIQNDIRTLDKFGEWFLDTTTTPKKLKVYFDAATPSSYVIKVGTLDTLINLGNHIKIQISYLNFEGCNGVAIYGKGGDHNNVKYCSFSNIGARGVQLLESSYSWVDHCDFYWCLSNAVSIYTAARSSYKQNCKVNDCTIKHIAPYVGLGSYFSNADHTAIFVNASTNLTVENNNIDSVGKCGISWQGSTATIRKNVVNYATSTLQDHGGIYTFFDNDTTSAPFTNRTISNNIVSNCPGQPKGSTDTINPRNAGIYLDGKTMNVNVLDNTVFNVARNGIHCNNPSGITIRGNTLFNNKNAISFYRWADWPGVVIDITIKKNICYSTTSNQVNIYYTNNGLNTPTATTLTAELAASGTIDSNYYGFQNQAPFEAYLINTLGGSIIKKSPMTFETWKDSSSQDAHSVRFRELKLYTVNSLIGSNKFPNPEFTSGITSMITYSGNSNHTATWNTASKISGTGSLEIGFTTPQPAQYELNYYNFGSVSNTKKYLLRYSTLGTGTNGITTAYLRNATSPYGATTPAQLHSYGSAVKDHEYLFVDPDNITGNGHFMFTIEQASGTTYIDKVEFYEVDATVLDVDDTVHFEYNPTATTNTYYFTGTFEDILGNSYNGSITLDPFTSAVLLNGSALQARPVTQPLRQPAAIPVKTALPVIKCYPNPAGEVLTIDKLSVADKWEQVQVTGVNGSNTMISRKISGLEKVSLDISSLAKGEYMAILKRKSGTLVTLKFLKL